MVEPSDNSSQTLSRNLSRPSGEGIVIDIGTGDGTFVYHLARLNPRKFVIGIDANPRPLEKISEKIHRKPAKGGLPNVLFLQAAVEDLPWELDAVADEIHVHFPWGSLLSALVLGDIRILGRLRRICAPGALLEVVTALDQERDRVELERLGITEFNPTYIQTLLLPRFRLAGFEITESDESPPNHWRELHTTWAKRLKDNPTRQLTYIIAQAV